MSVKNNVRKFFPKVEKVVDATKSMIIEVTKSDAASKAVKQHDACAIAVACKRKFHLDGVIISRSVAYMIKGKQARRFHLTSTVGREITSFDRGAGFATGIYVLSPIPKSGKQNARQKRTLSLSSNHKGKDITKSGRYRHITSGIRSVLGGAAPTEN